MLNYLSSTNKLVNKKLVQPVLQTEASLASQITNLTTEVKDLFGTFQESGSRFGSRKECEFKTYGDGSAD